jgi:hypothetical protein
MTDNQFENSDNQKSNAKKTKNKQSLFTGLVILFSLIVFGYFGFKYFQIKKEQRLAAQSQVEKYDNLESEIFDLADEYKNQNTSDISGDLSDMTVTELKEKGAEFIYQMLLKNQVQINDLREQLGLLKAEILKYKSQEKIGKIILNYVELREKFLNGQNYSDPLKNLEILAVSDEVLQKKLTQIKALLPNFSTKKTLVKNFEDLIPNLIATKTNNPNGGLVAKIRHNISKLVTIRKIDGKNSETIDGIIANAEKNIHEENYQEAMNLLLSLNQDYHEILVEFLSKLNTSIEVKKTDEEILNYLKSLT